MAFRKYDPTSTDHKYCFGEGFRAFVIGDHELAVEALGRASELLVEEHKDELHDSLGEVYLYYGQALLGAYRKEGGPFGEAVLKKTAEPPSSDDEDDVQVTNGTGETSKEETSENANGGATTENAGPSTSQEGGSVENAGEGTSQDDAATEPKEEEDLSDLQVGWEVLELSKQIFTKRGEEGRKYLAEALIALGEISLESGNYQPAIDDIIAGLEIQKTQHGNDSRTVAETFFKLGGAYSINGQIDEAIEYFNKSVEYLQNYLVKLDKSYVQNHNEVKELIKEVEEKIEDMKSLKSEMARKLLENGGEAVTNGHASSGSAPKQASDISHLVKRKRKSEDGVEESPTKKPNP